MKKDLLTNAQGRSKFFITIGLMFLFTDLTMAAANNCPQLDKVSFNANNAKGEEGIFPAQQGKFCYSHGFGGPTGKSADTEAAWLAWYNNPPAKDKDERDNIQRVASGCGIDPSTPKNWFSKAGMECALKHAMKICEKTFPQGAPIEIDNTSWWKIIAGGSHVDAYKAAAEFLDTQTSSTAVFTIVPKNVGEDLAAVAALNTSKCSIAMMFIEEKEGQKSGCVPEQQAMRGYVSGTTEDYSVTCDGASGPSTGSNTAAVAQ